ncbi:alcohol dehydrogenase family protein [Actinopolymorpha rutila]|uniref:NADPH:quinone reductase-like Zn-dependent oxidoreductase n=1 Tax=Actinopolymorpha rutila TaxID=446787 RepID=A0A852ZUM8_9ACTN|nr:alcohol dehydrogenase family protein [Actinopolymorpha rutila]NYH92690.1 NADPH:quinone reductase-like Zn-dependent oxidoreductase [Actinopolymorpha rutila]
MRAVLLTGFGGPERLERRDDVPDPVPAAGEVRVRVGAAAVNNTDIWTREGKYGTSSDPEASTGWRREGMSFPRIQGADVAGRIDRVGAGVAEGRIGERVLLDPMLYEGGERELVTTAYLGSERDGGFAEYVTIPAPNAHRIDSPLTDAELASFPTAYSTALRMLKRARVRKGDTVLVTGASGGVGSALVQLCAVLGADAIAVVGAGKEEQVRELGARATVRRDSGDLAGAVRAVVTEVDVVADVVAGPMFASLLDVLAPLGRYVVAGAIAGPVVGTDLRTVYLRQLELVGSSFGTHEDFTEVVKYVGDGRLRPLLAGTYPLADLARAQRDFVDKKFFGKLVMEVS